ncbi:MAG: bifunctional phosphoribosylaminoimidazolecarboxamide formyltransferase/IMP cyclohydrolase [Pyrinomonadaceae bacterium MAG19_C2-C3]|nr:bifunctional phosphoribosylaminoimidazolecarboxamide formyltransferase/IMP cyclohydrolase [Pyrinomonadaceae bacterium MAG19_C2-C3]
MTAHTDTAHRIIRRALLSVSDKTGIIELATALHNLNIELISTGGTATAIRHANLPVRDVSDVTGFPEMMDGRVKTLHPKIHGALLAVRDNDAHTKAAAEHGIEMIDLLVVNLYPFAETINKPNVTIEDAIENIDIGGPAMIRSAAKNFRHVAVITSPETYPSIIEELQANAAALSHETRFKLAHQAFAHTSDYDTRIKDYLASQLAQSVTEHRTSESSNFKFAIEHSKSLTLNLNHKSSLRYGENPHQQAALYTHQDTCDGIANAEVLHGKEMSYNNYLDADAAWNLVCDFTDNACAIIKHTNPSGASLHENQEQAYRRALACDPISAFGGIVAFNQTLDEPTAKAVTEIFTEVIIAPDFTDAALATLRTKKNLRVLKVHPSSNAAPSDLQLRQISGGYLLQTPDAHRLDSSQLKIVTTRQPSEREIRDLLFAWTICKHTKSNAIVYAGDLQTIGVGAGQMSRVDSVRLGAERAVLETKNTVLASDAFFPFRDGIDQAARHGVTAVIQPGGSVRDDEVIAACNEHNLAMVFTGIRHFKH